MTENGSLRIGKIVPDLCAFAIGLSLAWFLNWETGDLVWSLWLCSLVVGYVTILIAIGSGAYIAIAGSFGFEKRWVLLLVAAGLGVFFLGFFYVHFCGFHAGHSVFLNIFFPLEGAPEDGFGEAFMDPLLLWKFVFQFLIAPYGLFIIPAVIAEREHLIAPIIGARRMVREEEGESKSEVAQDFLFRPYLNVVRMHILIFFFGLAHAFKIDSFLVYAVVYFVYFFPWSEFRKKKKEGKGPNRQSVTE